MKLIIYNRTNSISKLTLEPLASTYEIEPHSNVSVEGNFIGAPDGYGEIEILSDDCIALYVEPDATVSKDGQLLRPNPNY